MILKILFVVFGFAVTLDGILMWLTSNFTMGNVMTLALGAAMLAFGFLHEKLPKTWKAVILAVFVLVILAVSFLLVYGLTDTATHEEDAVIVLGAAVRGEIPSGALQDRLEAAVSYHAQNPHALIVVTGGQGPQEDITEALAMERYLVARGIPRERILQEDRATSTLENFQFSKALLDAHFEGDYTACFITNEYHIYRSRGFAMQVGFSQITHAHSNTRWYGILPGVLRECLAVVKFHLIDSN